MVSGSSKLGTISKTLKTFEAKLQIEEFRRTFDAWASQQLAENVDKQNIYAREEIRILEGLIKSQAPDWSIQR